LRRADVPRKLATILANFTSYVSDMFEHCANDRADEMGYERYTEAPT
jgi:hypothetical protein